MIDHWGNQTIRFLTPLIGEGEKTTRIATGYFTVEGYDLLREQLANMRVRLMVGYDEGSRQRLRGRLIDEVMYHLRTWDGENRRTAVLALVRQLQQRRLQLTEKEEMKFLDARLRSQDHAKVYIVDDKWAIVGSCNLTFSGLCTNVEGATAVSHPEQVAYWIKQFDTYWNHPNTIDLSEQLLAALLAWLELHLPYDVYLKTINALIGDEDITPPRDDYKMPVKYQMVVIERVLRQLNEWGGAMLVASTGLGKTIMATHVAYRLQQEGKIRNALVFAPVQVHPNWKRAMASAGVNCEVLTRDLLDQPLSKRTHAVRQMVNELKWADEKYIIFVDESHHFKNMLRARDGMPRHSFQRLFETVNGQGSYIVLLTATPFAKGVQDLNNQLYLLPHAADPSYITPGGQHVIPGVIDDQIHPQAWKVQEGDNFFQEFKDLPVCTVISTSQVARDFAEQTAEGDYVMFGDEQRWIPQIEIKKVSVPVPLEREVSQAIREEYFRHKMKRFQNRGVWQWSETTIEQQAEVAWTSSPLALKEVVEKTLNGTYQEKWKRPRELQREILTPILDRLNSLTFHHDEKLLTLCRYLEEAHLAQRKVIIFTERHATAVYLEVALAELMPGLSVASVSRRTESGYELKDFDKEVLPLIIDFAPEANVELFQERQNSAHYDVFITTDAYSMGVNLQDASVVISYDLAWTPDTIIQRAGRVLRFWKEPRLVSLYVFVGQFREDSHGFTQTQGIENRLRKLTERGRQAQQFSAMPVFPQGEKEAYNSLADLSNVTIEDLGLADITEIEEFTGVSSYLEHITELKQNQAYANTIPDDISSAMTYDGDRHLLYLLLRHRHTYFWMLYDVRKRIISEVNEDRLLNLIQCTRDTPVAEGVDPNVIELHAQACRTMWLEQQTKVDPAHVERVCALYLLPASDSGDIGQLLQSRLFT